ncbi:fibronectin type III domain-containing protein [Flavobacterium sp. ZT3R18]|uniref:fibronectin type III domain-containing protein n=1 Tax=Flavobacterium sp. ZT3R18 TaxID=2594429 RepID=UPI00117A1259|nr:fibronectin type III domain-containing protein [Flavobacterium sp. ZT3R18]TRX33228.1 fibronectin type III domain-containing protein [Flavobacterium sp. ZT3R18]
MLKKLHICLLLIAYCLTGQAQTYPVTISTQLTQPSPIYLSNYANTASINSPIKVQLILNDLSIMNRQVRLKCYFQGAVSFVTNDFVVGAAPIYLEGGFPTQLTNVELGSYFEFQNIKGINPNQYGQPLPEGIYTISFEVYDFATNKKLSKKSSVTTVIFQNEPPFLNLPANQAEIVEQNIQNIVFSWTPRSINVSNVEYEFSLVEIWNSNTPIQNAFAYSPPLYTTTTRNTTVQYSIAEPQLIPGKTYAWRVKAKALVGAEEIGVFKNNGYSETYSFKYLTFCKPPLAITATDVSQEQAKVTWSGAVDNYDYQVNYREKNADSKWYKLVTPREYALISNLKPKTTYEYTVGAACDPGEYTHSNIQEFTTLAQDEIAFTGCGIKPDPTALSNKMPLPALFPNDVVTAGDFPIVVLKSTGSNGTFSGEGYVTLPFLEKFRKLIDAAAALAGSDENGDSKANIGKYTRIRITFKNIGVNTDFKLISGEIVASYDPKWGSMIDGDKLVENISNIIDDFVELNIFSPNNDIPETSTSNDTNTVTNPIAVNVTNPTVINPTTTNNQNGTVNNTSTTSNPSNTNSTVSNTNTNNTPNISPPIPEKVIFNSITLTANEHDTKRIAKEGQTLYYVNGSSKKTPITDLVLTITPPNLAKVKIENNVHWFNNNTTIDKSEGRLKIKPKDLNKDATIKSVAGFPNETERIVDVKFVDREFSKQSLSLSAGTFKKLEKLLEWKNAMDKTSNFLEKIPWIKKVKKNERSSGAISFYVDFTLGEAELENKEDRFSRFYYRETSIKSGVDIGLQGTATIWKWNPNPLSYFPSAPKWATDLVKCEIRFEASASAGGEIKYSGVSKKYVETNKIVKSEAIDPAIIKLNANITVGGELKLGEKDTLLSGGIELLGEANAEIYRIGYYDEGFKDVFFKEGVTVEFSANPFLYVSGFKFDKTFTYKIVVVEPNID